MGIIHSFWNTIRKRRTRVAGDNSVALDLDTYGKLESIGKATNQTPAMVANALIQSGLAQRQARETTEQVWQALTPAEQTVIGLICLGYTTRQIASLMAAPLVSVQNNAKTILIKFNVLDRNALRRLFTGWDFSGWDG
jgi:DNA-binding NarL/FixJ family response regulator